MKELGLDLVPSLCQHLSICPAHSSLSYLTFQSETNRKSQSFHVKHRSHKNLFNKRNYRIKLDLKCERFYRQLSKQAEDVLSGQSFYPLRCKKASFIMQLQSVIRICHPNLKGLLCYNIFTFQEMKCVILTFNLSATLTLTWMLIKLDC